MTTARAHLVDPHVTRWYHCVIRCIRRAHLLADGSQNRKLWLERRLQELTEVFAISVGSYVIVDNHLHVLVRLDPNAADRWSNEEVFKRWGRIFPPRAKTREVLAVSREWIKQCARTPGVLEQTRDRLRSLGWFMKCLKEPLSRASNREDQVRGPFFEGRFKSVAIPDTFTLLATSAFIDLVPIVAGIANDPESTRYTSIRARLDHVRSLRRIKDLKSSRGATGAALKASAGLEQDLWLCPILDRGTGTRREGMFNGVSLGSYELLLDYSSRLLREGQATLPRELTGVLELLEITPEKWQARLAKLRRQHTKSGYLATLT